MKNNITFISKIKKNIISCFGSLVLLNMVINYTILQHIKKNNSDKKESLESISLFVKKNKRE